MIDSFGDGWNSASWTLKEAGGEVVVDVPYFGPANGFSDTKVFTAWSTPVPTPEPTLDPTSAPTPEPTLDPTSAPTHAPTHVPTNHPCDDGSHGCATTSTQVG
jgi:hypothetical protein